jgi:methylmalonyl-CoA mutase C-terminal domain/subunit
MSACLPGDQLLKQNDMADVLVIGGGIIPEEDIPALKEVGVAEVFTPGTPLAQAVDYVKTHAGAKS